MKKGIGLCVMPVLADDMASVVVPRDPEHDLQLRLVRSRTDPKPGHFGPAAGSRMGTRLVQKMGSAIVWFTAWRSAPPDDRFRAHQTLSYLNFNTTQLSQYGRY
ncbi:hypothetical protein GQ44DRAFT_780567 [Phaeosphaeriaceae sp. PMI808]|nr:hypothetical protein GQ44DRAFT_780567 [Phaeosphaeriaceae sp. PMI808]